MADITEEDIKKAIQEQQPKEGDIIEIDGMFLKVIDEDFYQYAKKIGATPYNQTTISKF